MIEELKTLLCPHRDLHDIEMAFTLLLYQHYEDETMVKKLIHIAKTEYPDMIRGIRETINLPDHLFITPNDA